MTSVPDQRSRAARAERIIAGDLIAASRSTNALDDALRLLADWLLANPEATPDDAMAAMGDVLHGAARKYLDRLYAVLVEDVPAAVDVVAR